MELETTDRDESNSWNKILTVRSSVGILGIIHPRDNYELLIDRIKELLELQNIDPRSLLYVYDTKTDMHITKALWVLEMHTTKEVSLRESFSPTVAIWVWGIILFMLVGLPTIVFYAESRVNGVTAVSVFLFTFASLLGIAKLIISRSMRQSQEAAQSILYPA
jgi:hypothetical protein